MRVSVEDGGGSDPAFYYKENYMGYLSDAYRDFKWFEKMRKETNIGKRDFKQIEKIHKKNKMKKK